MVVIEDTTDLLRAQKSAAWTEVARRVAHEIKNPLTPITLAMHRIERRSEDPAVRESIAAVLEETANLQRLADEFGIRRLVFEEATEAYHAIDLLRGHDVVVIYGPMFMEPLGSRARTGEAEQVFEDCRTAVPATPEMLTDMVGWPHATWGEPGQGRFSWER